MKYGIANILPLILLGVEMGNVADKIGRTKGMARYFKLTELFDEGVAVMGVDFKQVKEEIKDLDADEKLMIKNAIKEKFDIVDDKLELAIEKSLDIVENLMNVVQSSIDLFKELKA